MDDDYYNDFYNSSDYNATMPDLIFLEHYIIPPLVALINIIGLIGNGALALILRKTPASNAAYVCILNLAIADLIALIFYLPFAITATFPFGDAICKASETLSDISTGVSAFSLIALSFYSFFGRGSVASQTDWSRKNVRAVIACIWVLAIAFAAPTIVFAHVTHDEDTPYKYCETYDPLFEQAEGPLRFIVYYAIPLSAVGIFYCIAKRNVVNLGSDNSNLAIWLVIVYAVVFFTENLATFWVVLPSNEDEYWPLINFIGYHIANIYRCVNPIVLYCVSDTFRRLFKEHVLYWCSSRSREPDVDLSRNREAGDGSEILSQRLL